MCNHLAKEMTSSDGSYEARKLAIWIANLYRNSAENCLPEMLATLFLLIDFSTFMLNFNEGK